MAGVSAVDFGEARRYLPQGTVPEQMAFAQRQLEARHRVGRLLKFYGHFPCRMARLHLLTASSVAAGRFCGFSATFNAIGAAIMPLGAGGEPLTASWQAYQEVCAAQRPPAVCDEYWLEAHAQDWQSLQQNGLDKAFCAEAATHAGDKNWQLLQRHAEITFGARLYDHLSQAGRLPPETTIALALALSLKRAASRGGPVLLRLLTQVTRDLMRSPVEPRAGVPGYRRIGATVLKSAAGSIGIYKLYQRGLRLKDRGARCPEVDWPVLETLLGAAVSQVHPLITQFYRNPGRFTALASLEIRTMPLMIYSRLSTLLIGQGLYEDGPQGVPARLRVFQRADGSMHFVRELYCASTLRVFDSNFVLRVVGGKMALVEVFPDIGVSVVLDAELRPGRSVALVGRDIYWRGVRLPRTALHIEFVSQVHTASNGDAWLEIIGYLKMAPRTAVGRFVLHTLLRRPQELGNIRYEVRPNPLTQEFAAHPLASDTPKAAVLRSDSRF